MLVKRNTVETKIATEKARLEQLETRRQTWKSNSAGQETCPQGVAGPWKLKHSAWQTPSAPSEELGSLEQQCRADDETRRRRRAGGAELKTAEEEALRWGRLELIELCGPPSSPTSPSP